jgi:hypothetical protein
MSLTRPCSCPEARLALSARRDGRAHDTDALAQHLAGCSACAEFEQELELLLARVHELEAGAPPPDLWARIEARLEPPRAVRPRTRLLVRVAAALLGFLGAHLAARTLDARPEARAHLLERWLAPAPGGAVRPRALTSPEYRLLLTRLSNPENER